MIRRVFAITVSTFMLLTLCLASPISVLADAPDYWIKTNGVNEITPALTKGTATFADDDGKDFVHEVQWGETPYGSLNFTTSEDALNWVNTNITYVEDDVNYGVDEAWANPEQTLTLDSGDAEDMAFLLASLLKWHTDGVNTGGGDLVYVQCGFMLPPDGGFHAWVVWWDASATDWHQLDPTTGEMNYILYPALGTLWLNDEHILGFLPGYYPVSPSPVGGFNRDDFGRIAEGGFNDPMNNYVWSMTYFNGDMYVGTGRNIPYMVGQALKLAGIIPPGFEFEYITHPREPMLSLEWAEDLRAEIWCYHDGSWERVYQSPVIPVIPGPFLPRECGFRHMLTFTDSTGEEAIYAASGQGFLPGSLLLKSTNGTVWDRVITPLEMGTDSRAAVVHNGKLYVGTGGELIDGGGAEVWATDEPSIIVDNWDKIADFSLIDEANTAVVSLESFNGYLYAGTQNMENGFQVFRSNAKSPAHPELGQWTQIVEYGGGDMMNYLAATMEVFNNRLYVGSMSLPLRLDDPVDFAPPKGFELMRIGTDDSWELIVGDYFAWVPPPGGGGFRVPGSGWPGGFANFLNFYCWSLQEHDGVLYLGTFDASSFLQFLPIEELIELPELTDFFPLIEEYKEEIVICLVQIIGQLEELGVDEDCIEPFRRLLEVFESEPTDWEGMWQIFIDYFAGADLWKSEDGIFWEPVTLNGFDNPKNYGFRTMVSGSLYVGTANPFQGCEVWKAPVPTGESTDKMGVGKDIYGVTENVYATGSGFPASGNVDVYIVEDLAWTNGMAIPPDLSSDGMNTVPTDAAGNIEPTDVWPQPLTAGQYDMVFDANRNGRYDVGMDFVDHPDHPGFTVTPAAVTLAVGGEVHHTNIVAILAPWLALFVVIIAGTLMVVRHRGAHR